MLHDCVNVLHWGSSSSSVIERVYLFREEAKGYAYRYLKTMGEDIKQTLHARVVIEYVVIEVAKL